MNKRQMLLSSAAFGSSLFPAMTLHAAEAPLAPSRLTAPGTFTFAVFQLSQPELFLFEQMQTIYRELFDRMGMAVQIASLPASRAALGAELGTYDGELSRTWEYGLAHPALIRVSEPLGPFNFVAYSTDRALKVCRPEDLNLHPYRIGYRRGAVVTRLRLEALVPAKRIIPIEYSDMGFRLLSLGALDLYVEVEEYGETIRLQMGNPAIANSGVVFSSSFYIYLNQRHESLAPMMAATLKQMKTEKLMARTRKALRGDIQAQGGEVSPHNEGVRTFIDSCRK